MHKVIRMQLRYTQTNSDDGYCCNIGVFLCCFSAGVGAVLMNNKHSQ